MTAPFLRRRRTWTLLALALVPMIAIMVAGLKDYPGHADVGLVLGSKVESDGTLSPSLQARLEEAADLYRGGYFPVVMVSGGLGREGYDEATVMAAWLEAHGVPHAAIELDHLGNNTYASAQHTRDLLAQRHWQSVLVISQYFHLPRARLALQRFGITTVYSMHAHLFEFRDLYSVPRECFGYVIYAVRSYA
jgi:vancomycin permeability regulator SanA